MSGVLPVSNRGPEFRAKRLSIAAAMWMSFVISVPSQKNICHIFWPPASVELQAVGGGGGGQTLKLTIKV